jgi:O-methyltransferase domain
MNTQLPPPMVIYQLASAHYVSQALHAVAHLGIADLLAEGPQTHETLATKTGTHAGALRRVLRLLASAGVFAEGVDGRFELTPIGSALRSGPGSSRAAARLFAGPMVWQCWGDLLTTVRTGEPAFARIFKTGSFEYFADHPEEAAVFDEAMGSFTAMISGVVAAAYDFSGMREVIDVGGGDGRLLTGILRAYPGLRGTVFDLPRLADRATRQISGAGLADRYQFVGGDFFEAVPEGGDAYVLRSVLHDWEDPEAIAILRSCRRAIREDGALLVVERELGGPNENPDDKFSDLNMLVLPGGRERTLEEFAAVYESAGFELVGATPTAAAISVIEGRPAP